jgi:hypothetical protein
MGDAGRMVELRALFSCPLACKVRGASLLGGLEKRHPCRTVWLQAMSCPPSALRHLTRTHALRSPKKHTPPGRVLPFLSAVRSTPKETQCNHCLLLPSFL